MVYPFDGVITADYPLTLLAGGPEQTRTNYAAVADYLRRPSVQRQIMAKTWRRPAVPDLGLAPEFGPKGGALPELPFPGKLDAANALIAAFGDDLRKPARTIYVLDLSGSMKGERSSPAAGRSTPAAVPCPPRSRRSGGTSKRVFKPR